MKIQRIVEAEVSISEYVDYIIRGGSGHYRLAEVVLPRYAVGDAVRVEFMGAQGDLGVIVEVLPHDSEEHGDQRAYTVRYVASNGAMCEGTVYEHAIVEVLLAARQGAMAVTCRGEEDLPDTIRPLAYLAALVKECRRDDIHDLLCGTEDPLAGVEAFVEAESLVHRLCNLTGVAFPGVGR